MVNDYKVTIGIECHVQLKTITKLFSGAANDARSAQPNTLVNHIDFGLPGALPVFNQQALLLAARAAIALGVNPQPFSTFDRKHYFYPDLPMGYQITQFEHPIIIGGQVKFQINDKLKQVDITRAHLESDAGKSTHPIGHDYSLVDLNRAGTPLLEIVSEPQLHSPLEAKLYAKELYLLMRYAEVTNGNLFHGNMRFDVNVSVSKTDELGTRTETKNLNSFRSVEKAVEYETKRQIELLTAGHQINQETRGWNEAKQKTVSQRSKENADDYRYMPDPDLPPIIIDDKYIQTVKLSMPPTLDFWRDKLQQLGLNSSQIDSLIEANIEYSQAGLLQLILEFDQQNQDIKQLANWLVNIDIPLLKNKQQNSSKHRMRLYSTISALVAEDKLSSTNAKELINRCLSMDQLPNDLTDYAQINGLIQLSNDAELMAAVDEVLATNPKAVADIKLGETKAIGFLVGQIMQKTKGQANPALAKKQLEAQIKNL